MSELIGDGAHFVKTAPVATYSRLRGNRRLSQLVEQPPGIFEIGRVEAVFEPAEDRGEQGARVFAPALLAGVGGRGSSRHAILLQFREEGRRHHGNGPVPARNVFEHFMHGAAASSISPAVYC